MPSGMRWDGMRLLGAVLAGGRSSRFGSDKALAMLDGRTLLDHAAAALGAHVETVVICGRHVPGMTGLADRPRSEEHTSELPALMRSTCAAFCSNKNNNQKRTHHLRC